MKKLVIASLVSGLLLFNTAEATDWIAISGTVDGAVFYVDRNTTRIKGNIISGWIKKQHSTNEHHLTYDQFDCVNMRWKITKGHSFFNNSNTDNFYQPTQWMSVVPESAGEIMWENMCKLWKYGKQTGSSTSRFRVE